MGKVKIVTEGEHTAVWVLNELKDLKAWSDAELALRVGMPSRQGIHELRNGQKRILLAHIEGFAKAFEVPIELFLMEQSAAEAWIDEHSASLRKDRRKNLRNLAAVDSVKEHNTGYGANRRAPELSPNHLIAA